MIEKYPQFQDIDFLEFEIEDEQFLQLIENTYRNKIISRRNTASTFSEGIFLITINDSFSIYSYCEAGTIIYYKDYIIPAEFNADIYNKMIELFISKM